jgi:hypothetical protein
MQGALLVRPRSLPRLTPKVLLARERHLEK